MTFLSKADEIWTLKPTDEDLIAGARYATITLPWTFNRMMLNTSAAGQKYRALNIAKGIVGQEMLRRALAARGVQALTQRKSHREDDLFDLFIEVDGIRRKLDLKTVNHYTNYPHDARPPLTLELIIANRDYPGPDWRHFFPMLVPHTQIAQDKEAYCFAIASSIDFRGDVHSNRTGYALTAFPSGEQMAFLSAKKLVLAREAAGQGFLVECGYYTDALLPLGDLCLTVIGEWNGQLVERELVLTPNQPVSGVGPFSCVSAFRVDRNSYEEMLGYVVVSVQDNDYTTPVYSSNRRTNYNRVPDPLVVRQSDFGNLVLPSDYTLYMLGWITKDEFLQKCRKYPAWVWPLNEVNRWENAAWEVTSDDRQGLKRAGFEDSIEGKSLHAGWMKTHGRGGGACCYVFPNIGRQGGVKETNLYVLPQDLHPMEELK